MRDMDIRELDLNLLSALHALLEHESVSAAARALGVTQPAMSRTLQRLREALGDPLLVRAGRGVVPTERARALRAPVEEAVRAVRKVFAAPGAFDPATATGELVVALGDEAQVAFADAIVRAVWADAPGVDVRVRRLGAASIEEGRRGLLDLAIAPDLSVLPPIAGAVDYGELVAKPLYTRRFVVAGAARRWPGPLSLEAFLAARHVIVSFEGGGRGFVDELLAARGLSRRVALSVTSFTSAIQLVASTDLLATVPREILPDGEVVAHPPPIPVPPLPMLALWHPHRTTDPRHRFLREAVMRAVRERAARWATGVG